MSSFTLRERIVAGSILARLIAAIAASQKKKERKEFK